jgi:hypothetical protein
MSRNLLATTDIAFAAFQGNGYRTAMAAERDRIAIIIC